MSVPFARDDYRTHSIDPAPLADHVRDFIAAIESDDPGLATISAGWNRFRYIIAPDPGGSHQIIERSDLSRDVKDRLQAVRKIGMDYGPHRFKEDTRPVLAMLRGCLPKRRKRRRKPSNRLHPLTPLQTEAMQLVGEHKGNIAAAAEAAGKSRTAMQKLYDKALKKLGRSAMPTPATKRLPVDRRGQPNIPQKRNPL